jgi:di/tricarboxylate transporter
MGADAWLTLLVIGGVFVVMARDLVSPAIALFSGVTALLVTRVLTPAEAFSGFANPAPITVAALYVLARAVEKSGALQPVVSTMLGRGNRQRRVLTRLSLPVAAASAFLNNTPIVAMLVPQITDWAERNRQSPSRYLMPLSFAAILGGMVTLIGTSTNLVMSGLLEASGHEPLAMFELTRIGVPVALAGIALVVLLAPLLLPERLPPRQQAEEAARTFTVQMHVARGGPLDGKQVAQAGLRQLQGVFLVELERDGETIAPVAPTTVLQSDDRLTFVGQVDTVVDLQSISGLTSAEESHLLEFDSPRHTFFEAVVGETSRLAGLTLKEADFRERYQAAVVAIHRAGELVRGKLGQVPVRPGDTLLLIADSGFRDRWRDRTDFVLVSRLGGTPPAAPRKAGIVAVVGLAIVVGAGVGVMPILHLSLLGALALVGFGVLTAGEAKNAVNLEVIVVIAAAFGLAAALEVSGLADTIAVALDGVIGGLGPRGVLVILMLATIGLTSAVTNNAAAALMFPLGLSTADDLGMSVRAVTVAITLAASMSFLTPIAYQTNLMVYGPAGYRFSDYARLGVPLTVLLVLLVVILVPLEFSR